MAPTDQEIELLNFHSTRAECTDWLGQLVGITVQLKNHDDLMEYSAALHKVLGDFGRRPKFAMYEKKANG